MAIWPGLLKNGLPHQEIGFGANIKNLQDDVDILKQSKGRRPHRISDLNLNLSAGFRCRAVFEKLTEDDLFEILKNPSNPIILGKKLDFAAYGIDVEI